MKIAYITPYYPPTNKGGAEISLENLAKTLAKLGHQVIVFTANYKKATKVENDNPKIYRLKFGADSVFSRTNPISSKRFAKAIIKTGEKFEIIDAYSWFQPAAILAERLKIPYVCSIRDATPICDFRVDLEPRYYPFLHYLFKRLTALGISPRQITNAIYGYFLTKQNLKIIKNADCLTFASMAIKAIFAKHNACGEVIYSIGLTNFKDEKIAIPGINFAKDKVVVYAGRLTEGKGAGFLFSAAKKVLAEEQQIKFIFIGDGPLRAKFVNSTFKNKIFFLGKKSHNFVLNVIKKATLTVVPSVIFEGFPRIGVESVSLGTPVIGANVGGVPEAIGAAGFVVEAGNVNDLVKSILKVCKDDNLYFKLKLETTNQAEKFFPKKIAQKVINIYEKVLSQ